MAERVHGHVQPEVEPQKSNFDANEFVREVDLAGVAVPDEKIHEEPQLELEEPKVLEEVPNAVPLAVIHIHKNLGHRGKELLCRALRFWWIQ